MDKDLYEVLDVSPGATSTDIRRAYEQGCNKLDDMAGWIGESVAEQQRHDLDEAYAVLSKEQTRRTYDEARVNQRGAAGAAGASSISPNHCTQFFDELRELDRTLRWYQEPCPHGDCDAYFVGERVTEVIQLHLRLVDELDIDVLCDTEQYALDELLRADKRKAQINERIIYLTVGRTVMNSPLLLPQAAEFNTSSWVNRQEDQARALVCYSGVTRKGDVYHPGVATAQPPLGDLKLGYLVDPNYGKREKSRLLQEISKRITAPPLVIVLDDDDGLAGYLAFNLEALGHRVTRPLNWDDFTELVRREFRSVLLVDPSSTIVGGRRAIRFAATEDFDSCSPAVILYSSMGYDELEFIASEFNVSSIVKKGCPGDELGRAIEAAIVSIETYKPPSESVPARADGAEPRPGSATATAAPAAPTPSLNPKFLVATSSAATFEALRQLLIMKINLEGWQLAHALDWLSFDRLLTEEKFAAILVDPACSAVPIDRILRFLEDNDDLQDPPPVVHPRQNRLFMLFSWANHDWRMRPGRGRME